MNKLYVTLAICAIVASTLCMFTLAVFVIAGPAAAYTRVAAISTSPTWQPSPAPITATLAAPSATLVVQLPTPTAEASPTAPATSTAPAAATSTGPAPLALPGFFAPPACSLDVDYIGDVTFPDGITLPASSPFLKIWRVRNSGCSWDSGFTLVWTGGEPMGAGSPVLVPAAPSGDIVDLALAMIAPSSPGIHAGEWRLRAANGAFFGTKLTVVINVPAPEPPPPPPTEIPSPTPVPPVPPAAPSAPTGLTATGTNLTIQFTWADNSIDEMGFRIYQVGQVAPVVTRPANIGTGGVSYTWAGRPCNVSATFYVKAYNAAGESAPSNSDAAVSVPCAPTGLSAVGGSASGVNISFVDNGTNESGFHAYRTGSAAVLATLSAHPGTGGKSGSVSPVICGQTYSYFVKAYNSAGESAPSNADDGTTFPCTVTVTLTSIHVYDDTDASGAGDIYLNLTVNGQLRRWPTFGTVSINSGENKAIAGTSVTVNLLRSTSLAITVKANDKDLFVDDPLGTVTATFTGSSGWSEGNHCSESAAPHDFRICYHIAVTP